MYADLPLLSLSVPAPAEQYLSVAMYIVVLDPSSETIF